MTTAIERLRAICAVEWKERGVVTVEDVRAALAEVDALDEARRCERLLREKTEKDRDRLAARVAELEARAEGIAGEMMALRAGVLPLVEATAAHFRPAPNSIIGTALARAEKALDATDPVPRPNTPTPTAEQVARLFGEPADADPCPVDEETLERWVDGGAVLGSYDERTGRPADDADIGKQVAWLTRQVRAGRRGL